jgi:drug/metabolite transporter (DMT)-like permease
MSTAAFGIPLALVTTSAFNTGLILEKRALTRMPALKLSKVGHTIVSLLSSPAWLTGFSLMLAGLACQVVVLTFEPISLVQPILASGVALTLVLSRLVLRERLGGAESWCVAALAVSIVLLAFSQDAAKGDTARQPSIVPLVAVIVPSVAAGLLITTWPQWGQRGRRVRRGTTATAICAGLGTGLLYGVGALMTKGLSRILDRDHTAISLGLGILSSPYLYLLVGCSAAALLLYQGALQACRASILIPVSNVVSSAYFVIAGTWLFHEQLPASPVRLGLRLAGIAAAGLVLVALSRQTAGPPAPPQPAEAPREAVSWPPTES